jgi:hypothetical protein
MGGVSISAFTIGVYMYIYALTIAARDQHLVDFSWPVSIYLIYLILFDSLN